MGWEVTGRHPRRTWKYFETSLLEWAKGYQDGPPPRPLAQIVESVEGDGGRVCDAGLGFGKYEDGQGGGGQGVVVYRWAAGLATGTVGTFEEARDRAEMAFLR